MEIRQHAGYASESLAVGNPPAMDVSVLIAIAKSVHCRIDVDGRKRPKKSHIDGVYELARFTR
jgi:hypothetical protein